MKTSTFRFLVLVFLLGCGAAQSTTDTAPGRQERLITLDEIAASTARNAQEVIELSRPRWLSRMPMTIYLNDVSYSLSLRDILSTEILSIELLSAADATTKYGTNHARGALLVKTK